MPLWVSSSKKQKVIHIDIFMRTIVFISIFIIHSIVYCVNAQNPVITPAWAFKHIVWEDSLNTEAGVMKLVDSYLSRNIPVEATIIDSPWSTAYNDFNWDTSRYPNAENMIKKLEQKGVKTILWLTGAVNLKSKDTSLQKLSLIHI